MSTSTRLTSSTTSSLQALNYHVFSTDKKHEGVRALETSLVLNSKVVPVLNPVIVFRSRGRCYKAEYGRASESVPKRVGPKDHILRSQLLIMLPIENNLMRSTTELG